jgi:hypothetical protein
MQFGNEVSHRAWEDAYERAIYGTESAEVFNVRADVAGEGGISENPGLIWGRETFFETRDFRSADFRIKAGKTS